MSSSGSSATGMSRSEHPLQEGRPQGAGDGLLAGDARRRALGWQRAENAAVALGIVAVMIAREQPWWLLLATFVLFDLSALGYLVGRRAGAIGYNLVHNYAAPAGLMVIWAALQPAGLGGGWLVLIAACWGFHVAVDRALGFGLKLDRFGHTHLGAIGKDRSQQGTAPSP